MILNPKVERIHSTISPFIPIPPANSDQCLQHTFRNIVCATKAHTNIYIFASFNKVREIPHCFAYFFTVKVEDHSISVYKESLHLLLSLKNNLETHGRFPSLRSCKGCWSEGVRYMPFLRGYGRGHIVLKEQLLAQRKNLRDIVKFSSMEVLPIYIAPLSV